MALTKIDDRGLKTPIDLLDSEKIRFGTGNDLQIYHDGNHSFIQKSDGAGTLYLDANGIIFRGANAETLASFTENGAVQLYYDAVKQISTTSTGVTLGDDKRIDFGDGADLRIYHDGSHSFIHQDGTGNLAFLSDNYYLNNEANTENIITAVANGAVSLYFDDSKKFETTSVGTKITGKSEIDGDVQWNGSDGSWGAYWDKSANVVSFKDSAKIGFGTSNDLYIYHNGTSSYLTNSTGNLILESDSYIWLGSKTSSETYIKGIKDGAVELYYNNVKKLETTSTGASIFDQLKINTPTIGNSDTSKLLVKGSGRDTGIIRVQGPTANGWTMLSDAYVNGGESLFSMGLHYSGGAGVISHNVRVSGDTNNAYLSSQDNHACKPSSLVLDNGTFKFRNSDTSAQTTIGDPVTLTDALVITSAGNVSIPNDSGKFTAGTGDDLYIYHDGSHSNINNSTGNLRLQTDAFRVNSQDNNESIIRGDKDGAVELYYDNSKKFETTSGGVQVSGTNLNMNSTYIDFSGSISTPTTAAAIYRPADNTLAFSTANTERARFEVGGALLVSTTSTTISQSAFGTSMKTGRFKTSHDVNGSNVVMSVFGNGTSDGFRVMGDGDCQNANNSYGSTSDETLKQDIVDAASQWEDIKALKVKKFRFKSNPSAPLHIGVIAQDLEKVSPGLVSEVTPNDDKPDEKVKTVKYSVLYMKAIKALQEAMAKIEVLETKVAALESS